ncbi:hypothetical protein CPB83DRAFT_857919, partial [Crepidotus variabilis]
MFEEYWSLATFILSPALPKFADLQVEEGGSSSEMLRRFMVYIILLYLVSFQIPPLQIRL